MCSTISSSICSNICSNTSSSIRSIIDSSIRSNIGSSICSNTGSSIGSKPVTLTLRQPGASDNFCSPVFCIPTYDQHLQNE